jgi:DNA polymerase III subunit gamma/tau
MVLYNKYRPKNLDEACGQELIKQALRNQIKNNTLVNSYLFLGPAGTGKTTIARIFASMINCSTGPTINPPSDDKFVQKILAGQQGCDVIEMDAASNNSVDDVRDIREKANYGPMEMRKKIYILDECHMLSSNAWNALLKIIEEPPEYIMFILCTTDSAKIPQTVLTRVQELSFSSFPTQMIRDNLKRVAAAELIAIDEESIRMIASGSAGSMRMALNYLERARALDAITPEVIAQIVGLPSRARARDFIKSVINQKFAESVVASSAVIGNGVPAKSFIEELANYCHDILVCNVYDMESLGYTKDEVEEVKAVRKMLNDSLQDFRTFVPKWVGILQRFKELTVFNVQQQFQINMLFVEMYNLYRLAPKKAPGQ